MNTRYRLHYAPDNASLIVRIALEELGQPYETCLVDRSVKSHKSAAYLALNPLGLIPVLETGDGALFETAAILLWLTEQHGALAPAPAHPERGAFLKWLFFLSNSIHADLRIHFYPKQYLPEGAVAKHGASLRAGVQARLNRNLDVLENLAGEGRAWFGAAEPSVLDLYLGVMLRWMELYPSADVANWFTFDNRPRLHVLAQRLEQRASVKSAALAEGLGQYPLSRPVPANPPEGVAL